MLDETQEILDALDLEYWFERESRSFKLTRGEGFLVVTKLTEDNAAYAVELK